MSELIPDAEPVVAAEALAAPASRLRWYVVHAYSGMEKAVERNIRERIERAGMHDKFGRILVPTEEVIELKNGKKSVTERRFFPGYVLVEMLMDDESWHLVKHTSKVTGFVGGAKNRPAPISDAEVMKNDPSAYRGYHGWQVYYPTTDGPILMPVGWIKS